MPEQRAARLAGTLRARIPREYQDASFQHSNISGLPRRASRPSGTTSTRSTSAWPGRRAVALGVDRHRQDVAGDARRARRDRARPRVAVYSVPRLLSEIAGPTTARADDARAARPADLGAAARAGRRRRRRTNPWVLEQLYTIINERWQERRSIVMTTNLDMIQMEEQLGERAASRLVGMCKTVLLDGVDHRRRHHLDPGPTGFRRQAGAAPRGRRGRTTGGGQASRSGRRRRSTPRPRRGRQAQRRVRRRASTFARRLRRAAAYRARSASTRARLAAPSAAASRAERPASAPADRYPLLVMPGIVIVGAQWGDEGRASSSTCWPSAPTSSSASRAATTPGTPSCTGT